MRLLRTGFGLTRTASKSANSPWNDATSSRHTVRIAATYSAVRATLRILEEKGYLAHTKRDDARSFVYQAVVGRNEAGRNAVRYLVSRFFRNSPELLVLNLLEDEELSHKEVARIRQMVAREAK